MTLTLSPYSLARFQRGVNDAESHWVYGNLRREGASLRLLDSERDGYAIDIRDHRLGLTESVHWPFRQNARFLLDVDIDWVLTTVVISVVHEIALHSPWNGERNYVTLFGSSGRRETG